jgi:hypothetical protein
MGGKCAMPGCDQPIARNNISTVCQDHQHTEYCRCRACDGRPKQPSAKPGCKIVHIPYATSNSGVNLAAPVTLRAAPWEEKR